MKALKILAVAFAVVVLALAGTAAWLYSAFDAARIKQEITAAVEKQTGRKLAIEGELALAFWPDVAVTLGRSTLSEADGKSEFARLDKVRVAVAVMPLLSKQVVVRQVEIDGLTVRVIKRKDGTLNIADLIGAPQKVGAGGTAPAGAPPVVLPSLDVAGIRIANVRLDWRDEQAGNDFSLDNLEFSSGPLRVADGRADIESLRLHARFADRGHRIAAMLTLSGAASVDLAKQSASVRLDGGLDASTIKAKVDIGKFAPLALAFDLDIDTLDLDRYLSQEKKESGDERIDLSVLKGLNLRGTVHVGRLTIAKIEASDIRVRIDAKDGRLNVSPLSANFYDGRLDGSLAVDANGNRFAAKQKLAGVRVGPLLKDLADQDLLAGRGDVALDMTTHGDTVTALRKALAGTAHVALADGAIKGIDIGTKLREAKSLIKGGKDVAVADDATQKTDFSELSASFRIANGVARNDDLMAKSPLLRLAGAGDIDIGNGRLDYLLKTSVVATSTGQGGKELDAVKGLTVPVRLTGPFAKPDWKIELAGLAGEAAKAKVEEKLKGKLKGLFR